MFYGYVSFRAEGGFSERFLNLCRRSGITLWELNVDGNHITACTKVKHYRLIKPCAVRSGMVTKILSRHGLPFFINKHRCRSGLLCGLIAGVCFISIMSTMVWSINISGNNRITDEEILAVLAESGIKPGTLRKNVDAASARFHAIHSLPELSYMSVNVIGSCIEVQVSETAYKANKVDKDFPCDVVSTVDGQIATIEVYQGTKMHKQGEAVRAGEALAGGFVELRDGAVRLRHAEAYALIRTDLSFETITNRTTYTLALTNEKPKTSLHFMGINIPLYKDNGTAPTLTRHRHIVVGQKVIPLGITRKIYRTYSEKMNKADDSKLMLNAVENYMTEKLRRLDRVYICSQTINIQKDSDTIHISTEILGEISAGIAKKMEIE